VAVVAGILLWRAYSSIIGGALFSGEH